MTLVEAFRAELDREGPRTRRALEQVPVDQDNWAPHQKSMPLSRLAGMVASMPSWVGLILDQESLDLKPAQGSGNYKPPATSDLVKTHDQLLAQAHEALSKRDDHYLLTTNWKLLVAGKVVMEQPRHEVLRDTINHLVHHRGQLTVYLRLLERTVPSIYGPTADDQRFL